MTRAEIDWGPIPLFAARLADTVPRRPNGWQRPLAASRPFGGPWGLLVKDHWTDAFPPIRTTGAPWLTAIVDRLRRYPLSGRPFPDDGELTRALGELHRFLVLRNVRFLAEVLPGPAAIPPAFLQVSATGLARALWVHELVEHGPPHPAWTPVPVGPQDWPVAPTAGDSLSLHLWIEELVAADSVPEPPTESARVPGGLRRATFLRRFPWLSESRDQRVRQRAEVVRQLLLLSPLSQWVYPDVIPPTLDSTGASSSTPSGKNLAPDVQAANDGWHALLARSLVAALLGPTPAWERRCAAEDELAAARGKRFENVSLVRRQVLLNSAEDLRQEARLEGILRPTRLGELFAGAGPGGTLIALRTMDMLVRHLATATGPLLLRDQAADPDRPTLSALVVEPDNRLFRRLKEAIFGGAAVADLGTLSARHRELTERLVVPPLPTDGALAAVADTAGVSFEQARRVRDRFARQPVGLPHPARDGTPPTPSPAALLTAWRNAMTPPEPEPEPAKEAEPTEPDDVERVIEDDRVGDHGAA